mmetsp:Transcript_71422/g.172893  ORF Transcript_71422/g.172893 Transcript_71422/m.172893 type:complete len:203 (+) Transcript_71422:213-821(+)
MLGVLWPVGIQSTHRWRSPVAIGSYPSTVSQWTALGLVGVRYWQSSGRTPSAWSRSETFLDLESTGPPRPCHRAEVLTTSCQTTSWRALAGILQVLAIAKNVPSASTSSKTAVTSWSCHADTLFTTLVPTGGCLNVQPSGMRGAPHAGRKSPLTPALQAMQLNAQSQQNLRRCRRRSLRSTTMELRLRRSTVRQSSRGEPCV